MPARTITSASSHAQVGTGGAAVHRVSVHSCTGPGSSFTAYDARPEGRGPGSDWIVWSGPASEMPPREGRRSFRVGRMPSGRTWRPVTWARRSATEAGGVPVSYVATTTSPCAGVLEHRDARVLGTGGDVTGDPDRRAVGDSDTCRPREGPRGGFGHRRAHRVVDREDGIGCGSAGLTLRLQPGTVPGDQDHGDGREQGDHHDGGRPLPPPLDAVLAHSRSTAARSARRLPFARNGTPIFAARALSSTRW